MLYDEEAREDTRQALGMAVKNMLEVFGLAAIEVKAHMVEPACAARLPPDVGGFVLDVTLSPGKDFGYGGAGQATVRLPRQVIAFSKSGGAPFAETKG